MGNIPGSLPSEWSYHHSAKRKNKQRAMCPEDLIVKIPKRCDQADQDDKISFLVNTNPYISGKDTLKPYRDDEHPEGFFCSKDEALQVAQQVFDQQERRYTSASVMMDTLELSEKGLINKRPGG